MSDSEKNIFNGEMSFRDQSIYLITAYQAKVIAEENYPGLILINDKGDAFRHAYWSALLVKRFNLNFAERITTAHEEHYDKSTYIYWYKDAEMDLFNNEVGRGFANIGYDQLVNRVKLAVSNGELRYLSPLNNKGSANEHSKLTPTNK